MLLLLSLQNVYAKPVSKAWKLVRQMDDVWVWKLKGNSDVLGTLRSLPHAKSINWSKTKSSDLFKRLEKRKKRTLHLIGITNWQASRYSWKKRKGHYELIVRGSYSNSWGQKVKFTEHHLYFRDKTHQILFSSPHNQKIERKLVADFIASIKGMVVKK